MKAALCTGPRTIELREVPDPIPSDHDIILEVCSCGICGSDIRRWKEGPPSGIDGLIPGHEASGVVIQVGKNVKDFKEGDRLAIAPDIHCGRCYFCLRGKFNLCDELKFIGITPGYPGAFAEKLRLTEEVLRHGIVHRIPPGLSFSHAALAEPCCSVISCHKKLGDMLNTTIVIIGAGPIGCLHVVLAKACGARVFVSQRSEKRRKFVERFHPDAIVNPVDEDVVSRVRGLTNGLGADVVICANPVAETQTQAVEMVRKAGKVILFGGLPKADPMVTIDANRIHYGEIQLIGDFSYHPIVHQLALELLERHVIPADQIITHTYALDRIDEAFHAAAAGEGLKVMVNI